MVLSVPDLFLLFGAIIVLGWLGQVFFEKTRIPDVLLLLGLGYALGPLLHALSPDALRQVSSHFGALALIIILFEGGLKLRLRDLINQLAPSVMLSLTSFVLGTGAVAWAAQHVMGLGWNQALLLGAILAGAPSGVVAIPVINKMEVAAGTRTVVNLEASLSDVFAIISVVLAIGLLQPSVGGTSVGEVFGRLSDAFLFSGALALVIGLGWLAVLNSARGFSLTYMLTMAVLFAAYGTAELLGASGALTVLLVGVTVANAESALGSLSRLLQRKALAWGVPKEALLYRRLDFAGAMRAPEDALLRFNSEVAFIVRTFFFVFLGVVAQAPTALEAFLPELMLFGAAIAARIVAVGAFVGFFKEHRASFGAYLVMVPRGLAAAALAYLPAASGITGTERFPSVAFSFIVLSNLVLTLGVPLVERMQKPVAPPLRPPALRVRKAKA